MSLQLCSYCGKDPDLVDNHSISVTESAGCVRLLFCNNDTCYPAYEAREKEMCETKKEC